MVDEGLAAFSPLPVVGVEGQLKRHLNFRAIERICNVAELRKQVLAEGLQSRQCKSDQFGLLCVMALKKKQRRTFRAAISGGDRHQP